MTLYLQSVRKPSAMNEQIDGRARIDPTPPAVRDVRLGRYCAAGVGAALFAGSVTTADAAFVYVNFNNQVLVDSNTTDSSYTDFPIDLNADGIVDFIIQQRIFSSGTSGSVRIARPATSPLLSVIATSGNGFNYASRLGIGVTVGGAATNFINLGVGGRAFLVSQSGFSGSQWGAPGGVADHAFLGIRFSIGGVTVNGFIELSIDSNFSATPRAVTLMAAGYDTSGAPVGTFPIPEPSTSLGLLALGAAGLLAHRGRNRRPEGDAGIR